MDETHRLAESLRSVKHFRHMPISEIIQVVIAGKVRRFQTDDIIFDEGAPCAGMYVLLSGLVHLLKIGPQGQLNIIKVVKPVTMFNEVTALDGSENPVTAQTVQASTVWQIDYEPFQKLLLRHPELSVALLKVLAARNRQLISHYADLSFRPVRARTAKLLLELSDNGQKVISRNDHSIAQMAARISSVPEAVSRALGELARHNLISSTRSEIHVLNAKALGEAAQMDAPFLE
ncbi:MAG: Crp/Fnr family transcriptional regulator [Anaerolineae bacterium CFX3]|nr:Crp/Fnr family transcriptional regulator [Anaerolineae bacterium]MCE7906017.1 Crp/Fnr family transcriptional regulator [Anaerolineae bacterium CFX3]MCZ7549600.1 Crp/Fnr family transcriptional regulator [Anaerolineales bacterium]OQY84328.1 MAG: hypothetical protein B6D40_05685 [Anaerolineae bacterium UTCFX3]GER80236.1 cAMP-dependent protein kinase [Candidatus Denitrolinea symbiosum]